MRALRLSVLALIGAMAMGSAWLYFINGSTQ
jgi:hypothetical protein